MQCDFGLFDHKSRVLVESEAKMRTKMGTFEKWGQFPHGSSAIIHSPEYNRYPASVNIQVARVHAINFGKAFSIRCLLIGSRQASIIAKSNVHITYSTKSYTSCAVLPRRLSAASGVLHTHRRNMWTCRNHVDKLQRR